MYNYNSSARTFNSTLLAFVGGMVVWALFGERIKDKFNRNAAFSEMKVKIMDRVKNIAHLTQDKYNEIVDDVSTTYAKAKGISQNELQDLISDLKIHWSRIKDRWNEPNSPSFDDSSSSQNI